MSGYARARRPAGFHVGKTYHEGDSDRLVLLDVSVAIAPAVLVGRSGLRQVHAAEPDRGHRPPDRGLPPLWDARMASRTFGHDLTGLAALW
jgi:hypothetical protein